MDSKDDAAFASALNGLAVAFGKTVEVGLLDAFWGGLEDLPLAAVRTACGKAIRTAKFFPTVRELRELSGATSGPDRIQLAFDSMVTAIRRVGGYRSPQFEDSAITATIRATGGWERWCSMESEEIHKWGRKEFERIYPTWTTRPLPAGGLAGLHEVANVHRPGHPVEEPLIPAPYLSIADKALMMPEEEMVDLLSDPPVQELVEGIGDEPEETP